MSLLVPILGMLWDEPSHPYEIKKRIQHYNIDNFVNVTDGAIYYNFESLVKKGYIEPVEVVSLEKRPDKTLYAITDKGRKGLQDEIYKSLKASNSVRTLYNVIPFFQLVEKDKLIPLIEEVIQKIENKLELIDVNRDRFPELLGKNYVNFVANYAETTMKYEVEWFKRLMEIVQTNVTK